MDGLGSVLGAIIALIIFPILGYSKTFLFAALPGILAVLAILFVKEGRRYKVESQKSVRSIKSNEVT
jgi:MFS family permease